MDFVALLPGVNTTGTVRNSSIMGLPGSALNITIDGLNVQDQALKGTSGSSFFAYINPRLDAVEEVTVSTSTPGAESSGQGAVQIRFQTRSGTNTFQGSGYQYARRTRWDTNYWFNQYQNSPSLPPDAADINTFGGRIGGPIIRDRAFFFFNYEEFRQPLGVSRSRTVLTDAALAGNFVYAGGPANGVNLYQVALLNGQTSTADPAIAKMLADINATLAGHSVTAGSNSVTNTLQFQNSGAAKRIYPTMRLDVNLTKNNRVGVSGYLQKYTSIPDILNNRDPVFPGYQMQGNQTGWRPSVMGNWRSVIGSSLVNELRVGRMGWTPTHFSDNITADQFSGGARLSIPLVTAPYAGGNYELRGSPVLNVEDTLNWVKGKHQFSFGASYTKIGYNDYYKYYVPSVGIGFDATNDPAAGMFNSTNFPGSSTTDLSNARSLYALLTGRITSLNNTAYLNPATGKYQYMGPWQYWVQQKEYGSFVQDSWKVRPDLTINAGVRYELQMPFTSANHFFTQLSNYNMLFGMSGVDANGKPNYFVPGATAGSSTVTVSELTPGVQPFNADKNNFAPSVGFAWRVPVKSGSILATLLSDDPVIRGGYSKSYTREGMSTTSDIFAANPGGSILVFRNQGLGNLINPGQSWPLLYRQTDQLNAPPFPDSPAYPLAATFSNSINAFNPNTQTPWVHSFNVGFQRTLTKESAVEFRYVGTRARGGWVDGGRNINELNTFENGFINEWKHAQANYLINEQTYGWNSTAGNTFKYNGLPGQFPLPIFQGFFSGKTGAAVTDPAQYTSSNYASSTQLAYLVPTNPNINSMASQMFSDSTMRANGLAAGYPANFFYMNPAVSGGVWVTGRPQDSLMSNYDALQIELRRRMSKGLQVQGSYQYIMRQESTSDFNSTLGAWTVRADPQWVSQSSPKHVVKASWVYELPFGQGRQFGGNVSRAVNHLIGGWSFDGTGRVQSGNVIDFGNRQLVGMTDAQLQKVFKLYKIPDATNPAITRVFMLPQDFIANTILAYSTSATTATGYSGATPSGAYFAPPMTACLMVYPSTCYQDGQIVPGPFNHHYVTGPMFARFDFSLTKRLDITRRIYGELRVDALNVFDAVNFFGVGFPSSNTTTLNSYQVTSAFRDSSNTQDPGGRLLQLSWRLSF
jgi:hypothetical protein